MDDLKFGKRNARGDWAPDAPAETAPLFVFPPRPVALLKWLPSYFLPYNVLFMVSAWLWWSYVIPDVETLKTFGFSWILRLYLVNNVAVFLFYGAFELWLYVQRRQGTRFKYSGRWPSEQRSGKFMFQNQNLDNLIRAFGTGLPIWTALEVVILHAFANGWATWFTLAQHPVYLCALWLIVPVIHETHFFLLHRALHWGPLYKWVHAVHHNSVNPSPWSSLSMHPVEHLGYLGVALWHLVIPSHPLIALYQLHQAGFGAIPGHFGFEKIEVGENQAIDTHAYIHYLHHRYFEVNYGDGLIPFDKWLGTFHDGSPEGERRMQERRRAAFARGAADAS